MKDIDFDELDRAVSSVLGQKRPTGEDAVTTQTVQTESSAEATAAKTPASTDVPAPQVSSSTPPLAIKRRGKFMDVMHPSADMTSATPAAPVAQPMRTSPQLKPLTSDLTPEASDEDSAPAADTIAEPTAEVDESHTLIGAEPTSVENLLPEHIAEETDQTTAPEASDTAAQEETTPPLDSVDNNAINDKKESPETEADTTEPIKSLYVDPLEQISLNEEASPEEQIMPDAVSVVEPTVTPFLADTKVDKRPLGAFGEAEGAAAPDTDTSDQTPVDTQSAPAVSLPRELQPDVVQVESSAQETEAAPAAPFTTGVKSPDTDDGRVEGHPLFDTSTYHEPIAAVHGSGMPGWVKWLIGLLMCLALGAGVGYFLFTAGL